MAFQRKKPQAIGVKTSLPGFIEPALATAIGKVPSGSRWIHEIKFDGYRVQVHIANGATRIFRDGRAIMEIGRRELLVGTASLSFAGIAGPLVLSPAWHERLEAFGRGVLAPHRLAFFVAKIILRAEAVTT